MILVHFYTLLTGNKIFYAEIYEVGQWNTIRFQGFTDDPNFMGILLLLPLILVYITGKILGI